ncbi:uncharacterized protein MG328 homolog [Cataglyphis hispanica]|uniref:uncharacterized protein MG328 homolog n=1 Tax=Cataglyphis hispanica TaxID=1086592 RepID=UPI00217FFEBC|nr:uncharacterized protein MG328 homolog [Cataglyphis hispanica]
MDLYGKDKGNVSLPPRLQTLDFKETKTKGTIINTQKCLYDLKIAESNKRIQRLEDRNKELENTLENTNNSIKILQAEKGKEISNLSSQINSYTIRTEAHKNQLAVIEKARINDKFTHIEKTKNIDEKYNNTRLMLLSQNKLLSAKTNVLEDYKSMQPILEKKLNMKNQYLIVEKEQMAENLRQIEYKFKIDREKLKKSLYNCLLDLSNVFQVEQHMPRSISKLLSENIAISNQLLMFVEDMTPKKQDCILYNKEKEKYKSKMNNARLNTKQSIIITKLAKTSSDMLSDLCYKTNIKLSELVKFDHLPEEQYVVNTDNAMIKAQNHEATVKELEVLLYREEEKLTIAKYQEQWVSDQLQTHLQMLCDVKYVLAKLKIKKMCNCK